MPNKIWLHKNTKYSTGDIVCGYQYDFVQGIEDEGGIENFVEYVPADAFIENAWNWVEDNLLSSNQQDKSRFYYEQFINYMKGE